MGGGGGGGGHFAGATQVSVMELPQQLLILHGQTLVHLGLLLKRLLQHGLLCGQLPVCINTTHKLEIIGSINVYINIKFQPVS